MDARFLRDLAAEGRTVVVSSHLLAEMEVLADDLVIIAAGSLVAQGTVKQVIDSSPVGVVVSCTHPAAGALSKEIVDRGGRATPTAGTAGSGSPACRRQGSGEARCRRSRGTGPHRWPGGPRRCVSGADSRQGDDPMTMTQPALHASAPPHLRRQLRANAEVDHHEGLVAVRGGRRGDHRARAAAQRRYHRRRTAPRRQGRTAHRVSPMSARRRPTWWHPSPPTCLPPASSSAACSPPSWPSLLITSEYRSPDRDHNIPGQPRRTAVIVSKFLMAMIAATAVWALSTSIDLAVGVYYFSSQGLSSQLGSWTVERAILVNGLVFALVGRLRPRHRSPVPQPDR